MTALVTRLLAAAAWLAVAVTLALPAVRSDATFNSRSVNRANAVEADDASNYLRLYSQSTDPSGLTGYALKRGAVPTRPAATGADHTLAVELGGFRIIDLLAFTRVFTLQARSPLPAGASPLTVTASLAADPITGRQPLSQITFANLNGTSSSPTATLTAGAKKQLSLRVSTRGFPVTNSLLRPTLTLTVTYPGFTKAFLSYPIPVSVWNGNGAGP
jgi:hypothetical protein